MKKIESFKSFSQLQNQLREEARLKEVASKREASTAAFNELLSKYNASSITDINEEDLDAFMTELTAEGNAFGAARAEAIAKGEKEFEVDGEKLPVEDVDAEDEENAEEFANESVVNEDTTIFEATVELDALDPKSKDLAKLLKKNKVEMEIVSYGGPTYGTQVVVLTGKKKDLQTVMADCDYGWCMDNSESDEFIEESTKVDFMNEALDARSQKDAVRGLAAINKFMAAHPAFAGGKTVADQTIAWLLKEALKAAMIDANFSQEANQAARAINFANFIAPTIFIKEMGGMPIQISKRIMMEKVYELGTEIARGVKYNGYAIIEAVALYMESRFKKNSSATALRDTLNKFLGEANELDIKVQRINEGSAFNTARLKAIADDKDEFEFDGKTYPVKSVDKEDEELADEITEALGSGNKKHASSKLMQAKRSLENTFDPDIDAPLDVKSFGSDIKKMVKQLEVILKKQKEFEGSVTEALDKETMKRMSGLTDTRDLRDFRSAFLSIVQSHIDEGFEFDDVIEFMNSIMRDPNIRKQLQESLISEGRAFAAAAKKAKDAGEEEFEFDGKTYPVTIKESQEVIEEGYDERKIEDAKEFIKKAEGKKVKLTIYEGGSESEIIDTFKKGSYGLHKIDYMGFDFDEELKSIENGDGMIMGVRPGMFLKWKIGKGRHGTTWLIEVL